MMIEQHKGGIPQGSGCGCGRSSGGSEPMAGGLPVTAKVCGMRVACLLNNHTPMAHEQFACMSSL
jgi:hypothetical protein